jgi:hypothetical protein
MSVGLPGIAGTPGNPLHAPAFIDFKLRNRRAGQIGVCFEFHFNRFTRGCNITNGVPLAIEM